MKFLGKKRKQFNQLIEPILGSMYLLALKLTQNDKAAEDLVQDGLLRAYKNFHLFKIDTNFRAWIFKVMTNIFYNQRNKSKRDPLEFTVNPINENNDQLNIFETIPDQSANFVDFIMEEEVRKAVDSLAPDYQNIIMLVDYYGFSYNEASEILNIPAGTVMSRLFRARKHLQGCLYHIALEKGLVEPKDKKDSDSSKLGQELKLIQKVGQT